MSKKAMSLIVSAVALCGFMLAIFIPGASAAGPGSVYTQYCENGTNTVYSQYSQYCEQPGGGGGDTGTTVSTSTTSTITTPGTTSTPGTTTTGTTPTGTTTTPGGSGVPAGVTVKRNADGSLTLSISGLTAGQSFSIGGVDIKVLHANKNFLFLSIAGVSVKVPRTAQINIGADGSVDVTFFTKNGKAVSVTIATKSAAFKPLAVAGTQYVILPAGKSTSSFSYALPKGVSFGKLSVKQIAKLFSIKATGKRSLSGSLKSVKFALTENKAHTAVTVTLAKSEPALSVGFSVGSLSYSKAEQTYLTKHHLKSLTSTFAVKVKTPKGKKKYTVKTVAFPFTYPV